MITSKLTSKSQSTIPQAVRAALRVKKGDEIVYQIGSPRVIITRAKAGRELDDRCCTLAFRRRARCAWVGAAQTGKRITGECAAPYSAAPGCGRYASSALGLNASVSAFCTCGGTLA